MVFNFILGILGLICFFAVVIIPWIIGVGEILDMLKTKEWRYK
jgi:hypothetical protein